MEIDVVPFLDYAISLLAVVITGVVAVIGKHINTRFKLEVEGKHREVLSEALNLSVLFAVNRARAVYKNTPPIRVRGAVVGAAVDYVIKSVPDTLKKFGINPKTTDGQKRIIEMLETRLDNRVFDFEKEGAEVVQLKPVGPEPGEKKDD